MNPSATSAAPRAEHDALDASPRVPTTYLPTCSSHFFFLLPTSSGGGGRRQHLHLQNSGKTAAASLRRTPRAFRAGGTLVVRVAMSATRLQIGIIRPVYRPYLRTLPRDAWTLPHGEISGNFH